MAIKLEKKNVKRPAPPIAARECTEKSGRILYKTKNIPPERAVAIMAAIPVSAEWYTSSAQPLAGNGSSSISTAPVSRKSAKKPAFPTMRDFTAITPSRLSVPVSL